jgi:hypothetical protein
MIGSWAAGALNECAGGFLFLDHSGSHSDSKEQFCI